MVKKYTLIYNTTSTTFMTVIFWSCQIPLESVTVFMPEIFASPYENNTYTLSKKSATYKEIISFIKKFSVPLVGQRTKKNDFKYTERPLIVVYYDVNYDHQFVADTQYVRSKILEVQTICLVHLNLYFIPFNNGKQITTMTEFLSRLCGINEISPYQNMSNCWLL